MTEAITRRCPVTKVILKVSQNVQENTCIGVFFNKIADYSKRDSIAGVFVLFSCEFCKIFNNTFFWSPPVAASSLARNEFNSGLSTKQRGDCCQLVYKKLSVSRYFRSSHALNQNIKTWNSTEKGLHHIYSVGKK